MDEKKLEQEYRKLKQQAAPDLWSRIEANLAEHPERETAEQREITAGETVQAEAVSAADSLAAENPASESRTAEKSAAESPTAESPAAGHGRHRRSARRIPGWRPAYGMAAAAALMAVTVMAGHQSGNKSMAPVLLQETAAAVKAEQLAPEQELAEMAGENRLGMAEETAAGIAGEAGMDMDGGASAEMDGENGFDMAEGAGGMDGGANAFSGSVAADRGILSYEDLQLAAYSPLAVPAEAVTVPEDSAYFSEAILGDTGLLCGGTVTDVTLEQDAAGRAVKVVYEISLDQVYYSEDYTTNVEILTVKSPIVETEGDEAYVLYQLQKGGTYLLPLENRDGVWELLYPFAPQIQVTGDGAYLFHSGYASLVSSDTSVVIGSQQGAGDYYYDRMLLRDDDNFLSDLISLVEREAQGRK